MANLVSHSFSVGNCWIHLAFKVKYSHKIFGIPGIKMRMEQLLKEAMNKYNIECRELGIDMDHVHMVLDIGIRGVSRVVKLLKGYSAKKNSAVLLTNCMRLAARSWPINRLRSYNLPFQVVSGIACHWLKPVEGEITIRVQAKKKGYHQQLLLMVSWHQSFLHN